jgi:hypothetical protein
VAAKEKRKGDNSQQAKRCVKYGTPTVPLQPKNRLADEETHSPS